MVCRRGRMPEECHHVRHGIRGTRSVSAPRRPGDFLSHSLGSRIASQNRISTGQFVCARITIILVTSRCILNSEIVHSL